MPATDIEFTGHNFNAIKPNGTEVALPLGKPGRTPDDKANLYLDGFISVLAWNGTAHVEGVIGFCYANSSKLQYHAAARRFGTSAQFGNDIILFNDAGFNTLGHCQTGAGGVKTTFANNVRVEGFYLSAWFQYTKNYGFEYRKVGTTTWTRKAQGTTIGQATSRTEDVRMITPFLKDDRIEIRAFIENDEGTFYGTVSQVVLDSPVFGYVTEKRATACGSGTRQDVYMRETEYNQITTKVTTANTFTELYVYLDMNLTQPAPEGWYYGLNAEYPTRSYYVNASGMIGSYLNCTPPAPVERITLSILTTAEGYISVRATISPTYAQAITITGYVRPYTGGTQNIGGGPFSLTIPASGSVGTDDDTFIYAEPGYTWKILVDTITPNDSALTYRTFDYTP